MSVLWKLWRFLKELGIRAHCRRQRRRLRNTAPTILCNNCIGGFICHDLGLAFRSPTVNLWMTPDDFCRFARALKDFLFADWIELPPEGHPMALLRCAAGEITLHLQHYESFEEAKSAWERRAARVDFDNLDNLFLILEWRALNREQLAALEALHYAHKAILTARAGREFPHAVELKGYRKKNYREGDILQRPKGGIRRRYEEWDVVGFLNG